MEFYDFHKDPITLYFLERIQSASTNQRKMSAVSILVRKGTEGSLAEEKSMLSSQGVGSRNDHMPIRAVHRDFDFKERRNIRLKNIDFIEKMSAAVKGESTHAINSEDAESKFRANEARIKESLNEQEMKIREKLEERKKNSFMRSRSSAPIKKDGDPNQPRNPQELPQTDSNGGSKRQVAINNILDELDPLQSLLPQNIGVKLQGPPRRTFN